LRKGCFSFGITFTLSERDKAAPTLNITLATHASANEPDKADFLAQHNQEASGTETELKELTTTEIADVSDASINEINPTRHTSVSTKSSDEAAYYNYWSDKIIRVGNKNFPKEAIEKGIFGSLFLLFIAPGTLK